jgi:hypothetical protein
MVIPCSVLLLSPDLEFNPQNSILSSKFSFVLLMFLVAGYSLVQFFFFLLLTGGLFFSF